MIFKPQVCIVSNVHVNILSHYTHFIHLGIQYESLNSQKYAQGKSTINLLPNLIWRSRWYHRKMNSCMPTMDIFKTTGCTKITLLQSWHFVSFRARDCFYTMLLDFVILTLLLQWHRRFCILYPRMKMLKFVNLVQLLQFLIGLGSSSMHYMVLHCCRKGAQ